jgi:integrase
MKQRRIQGLVRRNKIWWLRFQFEGQLIWESTKTGNQQQAQRCLEERRRELREGLYNIDSRKERGQLLKNAAAQYLAEYNHDHSAGKTIEAVIRDFNQHFAGKTVGQINVDAILSYQRARLEGKNFRKLKPITVNQHVGLLLRILGSRADLLRLEWNRRKLNKKVKQFVGKAYPIHEQVQLLDAAAESRSRRLSFALPLALNAGMRDDELIHQKVEDIDFVKEQLVVSKSKTPEGEGRIIALNTKLQSAYRNYFKWYVEKFGELRPEWYVFPGGAWRMDPTKPVVSIKDSWQTLRTKTGIKGRWHDLRHTFITDLLESGVPPHVVRALVGHVSERTQRRYAHSNRVVQQRAVEQLDEYREMLHAKYKEQHVAAAARVKTTKGPKALTVN